MKSRYLYQQGYRRKNNLHYHIFFLLTKKIYRLLQLAWFRSLRKVIFDENHCVSFQILKGVHMMVSLLIFSFLLVMCLYPQVKQSAFFSALKVSRYPIGYHRSFLFFLIAMSSTPLLYFFLIVFALTGQGRLMWRKQVVSWVSNVNSNIFWVILKSMNSL
jgi:hypothetical protein